MPSGTLFGLSPTLSTLGWDSSWVPMGAAHLPTRHQPQLLQRLLGPHSSPQSSPARAHWQAGIADVPKPSGGARDSDDSRLPLPMVTHRSGLGDWGSTRPPHSQLS